MSPKNKPTPSFYRPDDLPAAQLTVSERWRENVSNICNIRKITDVRRPDYHQNHSQELIASSSFRKFSTQINFIKTDPQLLQLFCSRTNERTNQLHRTNSLTKLFNITIIGIHTLHSIFGRAALRANSPLLESKVHHPGPAGRIALACSVQWGWLGLG